MMDSNMTGLKRLPVSAQEFTVVREDNLVYIDKTDLVWRMAHAPENVLFFARPRRFGKTMLVSTLEAYFQGKREYFEGLKIMELETEWKEHKVLRFDMSGSTTAFELNDSLNRQLRRYEARYHVKNIYATVGNRLSELIEVAANGKRDVVCLFDEYDYPLQHTLFHHEAEHEALKSAYREFFSVLKSQSRYIRFVFLTGVTKFTKLSLFSVLNNIKNVSFWPQYQALAGITADEINGVLLPYVRELADSKGTTVEATLQSIRQMYDGYHFCARPCDDADGNRAMLDIYNPYSLINALNDRELRDYWASSGSNQMLMDAVDEIGWDGTEFEGIEVDRDALELDDISRSDLAVFLYQSGYLTIKAATDWGYTLAIPNTETRNAIYKTILPRLTGKTENMVSSSILGIRMGLDSLDVSSAFAHLRALVAETPYSRDKSVPAVEEKFQFILKNALFLCNCRMIEELHVAMGRIDLVGEHPKCILVMELKMTANGGTASAIGQIASRNYADAFAMRRKPVYTVAIEFDGATRQMGEPVVNRIFLNL